MQGFPQVLLHFGRHEARHSRRTFITPVRHEYDFRHLDNKEVVGDFLTSRQLSPWRLQHQHEPSRAADGEYSR